MSNPELELTSQQAEALQAQRQQLLSARTSYTKAELAGIDMSEQRRENEALVRQIEQILTAYDYELE